MPAADVHKVNFGKNHATCRVIQGIYGLILFPNQLFNLGKMGKLAGLLQIGSREWQSFVVFGKKQQ